MNSQKNAHLTLARAVVDSGLSKAAAARKYNTTSKTVAKWVGTFRADGVDGLHERSSGALTCPGLTPSRDCAASTTPRSISRPSLVSQKPASRAFSNAAVSADFAASSRWHHARIMNATSPARSSVAFPGTTNRAGTGRNPCL